MARLWDLPEKQHLFYLHSMCGSILYKATWPEAEEVKRWAKMNLSDRMSYNAPERDSRVELQIVPERMIHTRTKTKERELVRTGNYWRVFATLTHCAPRPRSKNRPKIRKGLVISPLPPNIPRYIPSY